MVFTVAKGMDLYDGEGNVFMTQDNQGLEALYRLDAAGVRVPKPHYRSPQKNAPPVSASLRGQSAGFTSN